MDPIDLCLDEPEDYEIDEVEGRFRCAHCKAPFTWEFQLDVDKPW